MSGAMSNAAFTVVRSANLEASLDRAALYAEEQAHRLVTPEHLLLALTEDGDAAAVLKASGVDIVRLRHEIADFVGRLTDRIANDGSARTAISTELRRILDAATAAAAQSRRPTIDGAIVLAALVGEGQSPAAELLRAHGMTFEDAIRTLKGLAGAPAPDLPSQRSAPDRAPPARAAADTADANPAAEERPIDLMPTRVHRQRIETAPAEPPLDLGPVPMSAPDDGPPPLDAPRREMEAPAVRRALRPEGVGAADGPADPRRRFPQGPPHGAPAGRFGPRPGMAYQGVPGAGPPTGAPRQRPMHPPGTRAAGQHGAALVPRRGVAGEVQDGTLAENIPRKMRVAVAEQVEVRIAKARLVGLTEGMQGRGRPVAHTLPITRAMAVRLRSPDGGFTVESASAETQWIENRLGLLEDDIAVWRFTVTPRRSGKARLQLIVSARSVGPDGLAAETALPDRTIDVTVRTNVGRAARRTVLWLGAMVIAGGVGAVGEGFFRFVGRLVGG